MNRRSLIAGAVGLVSAMSGTTTSARDHDALFRLNSIVRSEVFHSQRASGFNWSSVSPQEAMYVGIMATWDEVSIDIVRDIGAAIDRGGRSIIVSAANEASGGINSINADIRKIDPSPSFSEAHGHFDMYMAYLGRGITSLQDWGGSGSESFLRAAIENLNLAAEERQQVANTLPYPLPDRATLSE